MKKVLWRIFCVYGTLRIFEFEFKVEGYRVRVCLENINLNKKIRDKKLRSAMLNHKGDWYIRGKTNDLFTESFLISNEEYKILRNKFLGDKSFVGVV